jgi:hypothetical protein
MMVINVHQYQQNEQSPLILTELTEHKIDHVIGCWKFRSWLGTGKKCGRVKLINWIPTLPS